MKFKFLILSLLLTYLNPTLSMDKNNPRPESPALLNDFIQSAIPNGRAKCKECCDLLNTDFLVNHYIETHKIETQYMYQCIICKVSVAESQKGTHMLSQHDGASLAQRRYTRYLASLEKK